MGYQVRQYSLEELRRISLPGAVVPSLFWALPIGKWNQGEVDSLWRHFTSERGSNCSDFGLLLVDNAAGLHNSADSDLQWVGAALEQLLPRGTDRYFEADHAPTADRQLMILSSACPHPGWGVLISIPRDEQGVSAIQRLVDAAIEALGHDNNTTDAKRVLKEAGKRFHQWKALDGRRPNSAIPSGLSDHFAAADRAAASLTNLEQSLAATNRESLPDSLIEFINAAANPLWPELTAAIGRLRTLRKSLITATAILTPSADELACEIEPKLAALKSNPQLKSGTLRGCNNKSISAAIRAGLMLEELAPGADGLPLAERADAFLHSALASLAEELKALAPSIRNKLAKYRFQLTEFNTESEAAQREWRTRFSTARLEFHHSIAQAAEIQWRLGARVLMAFESAAANAPFRPLAIPWDPARMIGWKLYVKSGALTLHDVQQAARDLDLEPPGGDRQSGDEMDTLIDGSYFTDYVHFIAISKPGDSPRIVTQKLLASLLRPTELRRLIATDIDAGEGTIADDRQALANLALSRMGWKEDRVQQKVPLAEWPGRLKNKPDTAVTSGIASEIRISLESLCKDILDIITHQLGYKEKDLWEAIQERAPDYRPASHRRIWADEVNRLTSGAAALLISALGPLAFPGKEHGIKGCVAAVEALVSHLNGPTHDRDTRDTPPVQQQISEEIEILLKRCKEILRELPWHLLPSFVHGEQPKVICGEAWSHGQPIRRMLQVIAFSDHPAQMEIVLWNPTGTNPVIADPVFLRRGALY